MKVTTEANHPFNPESVFATFEESTGTKHSMLLDLGEWGRAQAELILITGGEEYDTVRAMILAAYKAGMARCKTFHGDPGEKEVGLQQRLDGHELSFSDGSK